MLSKKNRKKEDEGFKKECVVRKETPPQKKNQINYPMKSKYIIKIEL